MVMYNIYLLHIYNIIYI